MFEVLDLCLECKGCKAECPTAVDMARVKAEFLALYQARHGVPLRSRFFAEIARISSWAQQFSRPVNGMLGMRTTRWLLDRGLGISRHRRLPAFAGQRFQQWWTTHRGPSSGDSVLLFVDTFTEFNTPSVGVAAVEILEAAGYRVVLERGQVCCGRPMISKGLLDRAKAMAEQNLRALAPHAEAGLPIVGLEPSCLLTLRDEYLEFFPDDPRARAVGEAACLMEEFLTREDGQGNRPLDRLRLRPVRGRIRLHGHCHAKSLIGTQPSLEMLRATGAEVVEIDSGCCGMAGSFGYEREHYDLSMRIGALKLFPEVREAAGQGETIVAAGVSCRSQILDGTGVRARHPIQLLAESLEAPTQVG
jgi:Fe-S oxidoreductase